MARKPKRRAPPSRIKYEKSHPTVSCRVSKELYDRLDKSRKVDGKSFADILKIGLGIAENNDKKIIQAKNEGWLEGYVEGEKAALSGEDDQ
jgi:predicted DNA-binding protein